VAFGSADARPQMDARCHDSHFPTSSTFDIHPPPMYCICLYLLLAALERSVNAGNATRRALRLATIYIVPPIFELFRQYLDWTLLSSAHMLVKFVFAWFFASEFRSRSQWCHLLFDIGFLLYGTCPVSDV
jgi:hypothetical protein